MGAQVKGYRHANIAHVQVVNFGQSTMLDQSVPVVTKADECVI
jgi:hypothetical protein